MIRKLLSGYPNLKEVHDPEGYLSNLVTILMMYCDADAEAAVRDVANTTEFPPSRYTLRQACERAAQRRTVLERLKAPYRAGRIDPLPVAKEGKVGDPVPGPDGKHPKGTILSNYTEAVRLYGRPRERE